MKIPRKSLISMTISYAAASFITSCNVNFILIHYISSVPLRALQLRHTLYSVFRNPSLADKEGNRNFKQNIKSN